MKEIFGDNIRESVCESTIENIKERIYKISPVALGVYFLVYLTWFALLEKYVDGRYLIHSWLDTKIPFMEIFIIPYMLWFGYVAVTMVYFCLKSRRDFVRTSLFLCLGMTICLIIYTIFPSIINLRPTSFPRQNIFSYLVNFIYSVDTPTNVCPSIHCLNSIGIHIGIMKSEVLKNNKKVRVGSGILMVSICLSTVFIKQHSIIDFFAAVILSAFMYYIAYVLDWDKLLRRVIYKKTADK